MRNTHATYSGFTLTQCLDKCSNGKWGRPTQCLRSGMKIKQENMSHFNSSDITPWRPIPQLLCSLLITGCIIKQSMGLGIRAISNISEKQASSQALRRTIAALKTSMWIQVTTHFWIYIATITVWMLCSATQTTSTELIHTAILKDPSLPDDVVSTGRILMSTF